MKSIKPKSAKTKRRKALKLNIGDLVYSLQQYSGRNLLGIIIGKGDFLYEIEWLNPVDGYVYDRKYAAWVVEMYRQAYKEFREENAI